MKNTVFALLFALVAFAYGDEKIYLPMEKLSFTDQGIFLKKGQCIIQLPFIGYDEQGYYLASNSRTGVTIVQCAACRRNMWWVEKHCCMNEDCPYYCY